MPTTIHPHLKRGLDFDGPAIHPDDLLEHVPDQELDRAQEAAKRRRIEAIATKYLSRGKVPVILSGSLRGPFNDGWKNPWASQPLQTRKSPSKNNTTDGRGNLGRSQRRNRVQNAAKDLVDKYENVATTKSPRKAPSPEASRATRRELDLSQQIHTQEEVEVPPATAPLSEDDASGATLFYSAATVNSVQERSQLTNPFWVRRSESQRKGNARSSTCGDPDSSPIRTRSRNPSMQKDPGRALRVAPPKAPLPPAILHSSKTMLETWMSSASASMIISPPAKASSCESDNSTETMVTGSTVGHENRPANDSHTLSATLLVDSLVTARSPQNFSEQVREDNPQRPQTSGAEEQSVHISTQSPKDTKASISRSPSKIVVECAAESDRPKPRTKPRAVNFDSLSPLPKTTQNTFPRCSKTVQCVDGAAQGDTTTTAQSGVEADEDADNDAQGSLQFEQPNHNSALSTQAAFMLAQLEFQESSHPATSPDHRRPWSQTELETPRAPMTVLSAAVTPLSVFHDGIDKLVHEKSVFKAPPMSTQDLFGAASPFAFSTIKKKSQTTVNRSNSKFSFGMSGEGDMGIAARSPTPSAERVPLKDKNISTTLWTSIIEKASQASQESLVDRSRRSINDVELPQLDFRTSLDEYGSNGDLHFADRFLHDLANT